MSNINRGRDLIIVFVGGLSFGLMSSGLAVASATSTDRPTARIIGGTDATTQYPWMVSIQEASGNGDSFCGGTLIGPSSVLTASHCMGTPLSERPLNVVLGTNDLDNLAGSESIPVSYINLHPRYESEFLINDVAVLRLSSPSSAELAIIAETSVTDNLTINDSALLLGWGATSVESEDEFVYPRFLQQAMVPIQDRGECLSIYSETGFTVTNEMLCASQPSPAIDSCSGDSGGPLLFDQGGELQQIGLVSFGSRLCDPEDLPGVYTDTTRYRIFIEQALKGPVLTANFGVFGVGRSVQQSIAVSAWSDFSVNGILSQDVNVTSVDFSDCVETVSEDATCNFRVVLSPNSAGQIDGSLLLDVESEADEGLREIEINLTGWGLDEFASASSAVQRGSESIEWYTGGDSPWVVSTKAINEGSSSSLQAGNVSTSEESILMAYGQGGTTFRFYSQLVGNSDAGELVVTVTQNGLPLGSETLQTFGESKCSSFEALAEGEFQIVWRYLGKRLVDDSSDRDSVQILIDDFEVGSSCTSNNNQDGGGGTFSWFEWLMLGSVFRLRKLRDKLTIV